jgi:hypothetical protein
MLCCVFVLLLFLLYYYPQLGDESELLFLRANKEGSNTLGRNNPRIWGSAAALLIASYITKRMMIHPKKFKKMPVKQQVAKTAQDIFRGLGS